MGAINNAFNQALGAAAGAGLAIKHAKESDFSKAVTAEHSALVAKNQAVDAEAAADEVKEDYDKTNDEYWKALTDKIAKQFKYDDLTKSKDASSKAVGESYVELQAADKALEEVGNKIKGIEAIRQRAKDQRAYADKAGQIAAKAQNKYQSKWGGK